MLLERTLSQLDIGYVPPKRAAEMGQLGYVQWLGSLPSMAEYRREAMCAYILAAPFAKTSPAVAVFCELLVSSTRAPLQPLPLAYLGPSRRGGARARRAAL